MKKKAVSAREVRDNIAALKGKMLQIKVNKGRKRIIKYSGEIDEILPSLFTMSIIGEKNITRLSCSYSDVICGDIVISEKK
ncbi:MAG: Veg family protein [Clostridia bacterium]|nr:Veg family protein [Clostridia bacterium]